MKLLGLIFIIASSALCGLNHISEKQEKLKDLRSFIVMLELVKSELSTTLRPLPHLFSKISDKLSGKSSELLKLVLLNMSFLGEKSFELIWAESLQACEARISCEEHNALSGLGAVLGKYDVSLQVHAIDECLTLLKTSERNCVVEFPQTKRLSLGVSISAGFLLAIILF